MVFINTDKDKYSRIFKSKGSPSFGVGVYLMSSSFLVYFAYPSIPFLPYSTKFKVYITFIAWGVAWALFAAGFAILGKEGYKKIKDFAKGFFKAGGNE